MTTAHTPRTSTTTKRREAVAQRDAARRRIRRVSLGASAAAIAVASLGAVALAQPQNLGSATANTGSASAQHKGGGAAHVSSGNGQTPVATSGGS